MKKLLFLILTCFFASCTFTPGELDDIIDQYKQDIDKVRKKRGEKCAPRQLAFAEAHLKFAKLELDRGELIVVEDHLDKVAENLSDSRMEIAKCPREVQDKDFDSIPDHLDSCPDNPEDYDGYEDEDGCPEEETADFDKDGIPDMSDKCPKKPEDYDGVEDEDGCPDIELDRDKDGIKDKKDKCPDEPEDKDGFKDRDGCPDKDNDNDGIEDLADKCPNTPGVVHRAGCPEPQYKLVFVNKKKKRIEIKQKIYFDTGRDSIKSISFPVLDEIAAVLVDNPKMEILIEGHTDSVGSDSYNMRLSDSRAKSVRRYLIEKKIVDSRLMAIGFGETKPLEGNESKAGREKNRRVEFKIIRQ